MLLRAGKSAHKMPLLALFLCILLISDSVFSFEPVTEGKFNTLISVVVSNKMLDARLSYFNMSYFSKPLPENYPKPIDPASEELPPNFFQPPNPSKPYSQVNFSVKRMDLANASLYFTVIVNDITEYLISDAGGNPICNPVITDVNGSASCNVEYFIDANGRANKTDGLKTCIVAKVSFKGMSVRGADFPSSSQSGIICPKDNPALTVLGSIIARVLSMPENVWLCFPVIVVLCLMVSSMYYSGRDPLSLFDITTPRLPKVRQFRVKASTAPQMIRSVLRKYLQMQKKLERDATKAMAMAVRLKGRDKGLSREQIANDVRKVKREIKAVFADLSKALKGAEKNKTGLSDKDLANLTRRLDDLFLEYKPSRGRELTIWSKHYEAVAPFIELYNATHQAMMALKEGRGSTKNWFTRKVSTPIFDKLTSASVRAEENKAVRFLGKVPILKSIVNTPTKAFDALSQYRASRSGAIVLRREIMGGIAYSLMRATKSTGAVKKLFDSNKVIGKFFKWSYAWNFKDYEDRHDMRKKKFKELYDPVANTRKLSIELQNTMYAKLLAQLTLSLPTRETFLKAITSLKEQIGEEGLKINRSKIYDIILNMHGKSAADGFLKKCSSGGFNDIIKKLNDISKKIESMDAKKGGNIGVYLKEYQNILKENPWIIGDAKFFSLASKAQWQRWSHWEEKLAKIADPNNKEYATQTGRLNVLYKLAKEAGTADRSGLALADLAAFGQHERNVVRAVLLARMENNLYNAIEWDTIRNEKGNLTRNLSDTEADKELRKKYGYDSTMEAKFNRDMEAMRSRLISSNLKIGFTELLRIRDAINTRVQARIDGERHSISIGGGKPVEIRIGSRTDSFAMLRYNMTGMNAAGEILTRKLQALGINDVNVKDIRELELFFLKGSMAGANQAKLEAAAKRLHLKDADELLKKMLVDTHAFLQNYNIQNQKTADIFFSPKGKEGDLLRSRALADISGKEARKELLRWTKPEEQFEYAGQRVSGAYSTYGMQLETLLSMNRLMERAAGFVVWGKREGGSWGDSTLGLLGSLRNQNVEALGILKAFYANLKNDTSKFHDSKFAEDNKGKNFEEAYLSLRKRGYNFQDIRNGLGFMVSGDRRGGLPFLEHNTNVLKEYGYASKTSDGTIVGKGEVRDISALLARMADSPYINLPSGISVLIKHTDKATGKETWVYGDPLKSKSVRELYQQAGQDVNRDSTVSISNQLAGYNSETGKYNPNSQKIKIIATRDLREVKNNPNNFFGNVTSVDRIKGFTRNIIHNVGLAVGEAFYSGVNFRASQMEKWYASQYQVRQALSAYETAMNSGMTGGKDRLAKMPEKDYQEEREKYASNNLSSHSMLARGEINDAVYKDRLNKIEAMQKGDSTFMGTMSATWNQFKRNIFAKTATELSEAESKIYSAKLELRAIEKQHSEGSLDPKQYARQKSIVEAAIQNTKADYSDLKTDYKDYNSTMRFWTSSHDQTYGSRYNVFGTGILGKIFDSRFQQGAKIDHYWISESGSMRDPRTATGAGFGLDYAFYVGYQTGQTVYERNRFYGTNAMWEQQMRYPLNISSFMHKWFNPMVSQAMRDTSHYPSFYEMDALYPGQSHTPNQPGSKHDLIMPMILAPFRRHYSSDFWRTRVQYALDQSGLSPLIGAYQSTETGGDPGIFRKGVDTLFAKSDHYSTEARFIANQRILDRVNHMDKILDKYDDAKAAYDTYTDPSETQEKKNDALRTLGKYIDMVDRRPFGVQRAVSGSDMDEDGSRNRFMNLYIGFHENIWLPTVPAMQDVDPITGRWKPFPQIATAINRGEEGSRMDNLKSFNIGTYDEKEDKMVYKDSFSTHSDALRETYKRESTGLLHLMKYQNEMLGYSFPNAPSIIMLNPGFWGAAYYSRKLFANSKWGSTFAGADAAGEYGDTDAHQDFSIRSFGPYAMFQRSCLIIKNNFYHAFDHNAFEREKEERLRTAVEMHKSLGKDKDIKKSEP